jgi:hypothetical protein
MKNEPHEFSRRAETLIASLRSVPGDVSRSHRRREHLLGEAIDKVLQKYHVGVDAPDHTIRQHWAEIVGTANAAYSHPAMIDPSGRLIVAVSHAVVRDELRLLEPVLLDRVHQLHGCEHICALILRAG